MTKISCDTNNKYSITIKRLHLPYYGFTHDDIRQNMGELACQEMGESTEMLGFFFVWCLVAVEQHGSGSIKI